MFRFIKSAAFAAAAIGALLVATPEAMAWGHHGGWGHHHHHWGGWGFHRHHHWGYGRPYPVYGSYCRPKRYVNYYGAMVVRRVCY